jgi:hypothetical protein
MMARLKKHAPELNSILLVLMLVVPFFLYYFARSGSKTGVLVFLGAMGVVMLAALKK